MSTVEIHRHRQPRPAVMPYRGPIGYMGNTEGHATVSAVYKTALGDLPRTVRGGDWLVFRDGLGVARAWGHVDTVGGGAKVSSTGSIATIPVSIACSSWFDFLGRSRIYVPQGWAETKGTLMSLDDWADINVIVGREYVTGSLGIALQKMHSLIAKIRLPESLGGELIADAIPIVHDTDTAAKYAPNRVIDSVAVARGLPSAMSFNFYESTVQELYTGTFVPDGDLIEMFPSLEDLKGNFFSSKLAQVLGRQPVLIYRLRPFRARPLIEAAVVNNDFVEDAGTIYEKSRMRVIQRSALSSSDFAQLDAASRVSAERVSQQSAITKYQQGLLLENLFTQVTWDTGRAIVIPASIVRSITFQWNDAARVNCSSITLSTEPGTGIEAAAALGLPITQQQSIEEHGLRLTKPSWPFIIPAAKDTQWVPYMRSIAAQKMQFLQTAHTMSNGTIEINYSDATAFIEDMAKGQTTFGPQLPLPVGEMGMIQFENAPLPFFFYIQAVDQQIVIKDDGTETAKTSIQYTRGLYGIEDARDVDFPIGTPQTRQPPMLINGINAGPQTDPKAVQSNPAAVCQVGIMLYANRIRSGVYLLGKTPAEQQHALSLFKQAGGTHLVIKVLDDATPFLPDERIALTGICSDVGLEIEYWGGVTATTVAQAELQAEAIVGMCLSGNIPVYYTDAEDTWVAASEPPDVTMEALARRVHTLNPELRLAWTNYSERVKHGRPLATEAAVRQFQLWAPQCYGTSSATTGDRSYPALQRVHLERIRYGLTMGLDGAPVFANGRVDEKGQQWSPWRGQYGVLSVIQMLRLNRVNVWFGANSQGRLTGGSNDTSPDGPFLELVALASRRELG